MKNASSKWEQSHLSRWEAKITVVAVSALLLFVIAGCNNDSDAPPP
jgi:hypothetical protein